MKTNAARQLDALGIAYELRSYEVDPDHLTAISVARKIGLPPEQVFKTLLTHTAGRSATTGRSSSSPEHLFAVIPGDTELDLKKLASAAGARKAELAALKEVEPLTGYIRGGVTVLAARKPFRSFVDETIELFDVVSVSGGQRGLQLLLSPADYLRASQAVLADLTKAARTRPEVRAHLRVRNHAPAACTRGSRDAGGASSPPCSGRRHSSCSTVTAMEMVAKLGWSVLTCCAWLGCHTQPVTVDPLTRDAFIGNYVYRSADPTQAAARAHAMDRLVLRSNGRYELVRGASARTRTEQEGMWSFDGGSRPTITLEEEGYSVRTAGHEVRLLIDHAQNEWYAKAEEH